MNKLKLALSLSSLFLLSSIPVYSGNSYPYSDGVDKIIAGADITINPANGIGNVTINSTALIADNTNYVNLSATSQTKSGPLILNSTMTATGLSLPSGKISFSDGSTFAILNIPSASSAPSGRIGFNNMGNGASRRWWISNDAQTFGDFSIETESSQGLAAPNTVRLNIDASGRVLLNAAASYGRLGQMLETNTSANYGGMSINTWSATSDNGPLLDLSHSKSATIGTQALLANGDVAGTVIFRGSDGTAFKDVAYIQGIMDATTGAGDMPGRLGFFTTPDGATSVVEAMRINNAQNIHIGPAGDASSRLDVENGSGTIRGTNAGLKIAGNTTVNPLIVDIGGSTDSVRVDKGGRLLVGAGQTYGRLGHLFEVNNIANQGGAAITGWYAGGADGPLVDFNRSNSSTLGTQTIVTSGEGTGGLVFRGSDGTSFQDSSAILTEVDGTPGAGDMPGRITFHTTPDGSASVVERARIDNVGRLLVHATAAYGRSSQFIETNAGGDNGGMSLNSWFNDGGSSPVLLDLNKSKSSVIGTQSLVSNGDQIGALIFRGSDGTAFKDVGAIVGEVDGASGAGDMPGRIRIITTPDGSVTGVERIRITNSGNVLINGTAAYGRLGQLFETNTSANYGGAALNTWSTTADQAPIFDFNRSKSATIGTHSALALADSLGFIVFRGSDGGSYQDSAYIKAIVDATPSGSSMPGRVAIFTTPSGSTTALERIRVTSNGSVDIGSATLAGGLSVTGADNVVVTTITINAAQASITTADTFMSFNSTTGQEASIAGTGVAGVIAYNTFTGSHWTNIDDKKSIEVGMALCSTGEKVKFKKTGNKEQLVKSKISDTRKSKEVWGVYGGTDKDGKDTVLALGTGIALVYNTGQDIQIGDYLMTSSERGLLEKQEDDLLHNYTVAKSLVPVKWKNGEKKRRISVTYHAG